MPTAPESEFIERAIAGDRQSFRWLVEKHQGFVLAVCWRLTGNRGEAEDLTQETFVRLWKNLARYRYEVKLTTWLYKIATNLCLDHLKSRRRREEKLTLGVDEQVPSKRSTMPDQLLINDEFRVAVLKMKDELTPKQKAVFVLRDLEELPVAEVCDILTMTPGNVKANLFLARVKMSELIQRYYKNKTEVL